MTGWLRDGNECVSDLASLHIPPEIGSPLALHDTLFQAIVSKVSMSPTFDRKATDTVARLDKFPEGGGKQYLLAHGEPSANNFYRLIEGYVWRQSSAQSDKIFSLVATMERDCVILCSQPNPFPTPSEGPVPDNLAGRVQKLWIEWTVFLHGRAFYMPSHNI